MTDLRKKAKDIQAAGEAERGNFTPHGVPARMYSYWLTNTDSKKGKAIRYGNRRENFCHFWRVVLIWAPLLALGLFIDRNIAVIGISILAISAIALTIFAINDGDVLRVLLYAVGISLATAAGLALLFGLAAFVENNWRSSWTAPVQKVVGFILCALAALATGTMLYIWAVETSVLTVIVSLAIAAVAIAILVFTFIKLSDYIAGLRAMEKEKQDARRKAFYAGEMTLEEYAGTKPAREPGRVAKFFSGIGDFIVLIMQVVRVNKWKICPLVEVDTRK